MPSLLLKKILDPFKDRRKVYELLVGILLLLLMSGLGASRVLDPFEMLFLDWRFQLRGEKTFPKEITIIGIEEASLDKFGRWPWPSRDNHAQFMSLLKQPAFRPSVVGFDILFESESATDPQGDENFVYHTKGLEGRAIMAYFFEKGAGQSYEYSEAKEKYLEKFSLPDSKDAPERLSEADKVSLPYLELAKVCSLAFVNTPKDPDGRTRSVQLLWKYLGKIYPSMDLLAVVNYLDAKLEDVRLERRAVVITKSKAGPRVIPVDEKGEMLIHYYGSVEKISKASFIQIMEAHAGWIQGKKPDTEFLRARLKDKIVIVGTSALGIEDFRVTPFRESEPGISLHAQVIGNILEQDYLRRARPPVSYGALILLGLAVILATMFYRITDSLPTTIGLGVLYFLIAAAVFSKGIWLDVAVHEATVVALFIGITSFRYFTALEELRRTQEQLIQSTKMASLGQLSAGIAHEFRNILNAVNLHVEFCSQPDVPPEKVTKYLGVIKGIMTNANLILNGLLTFARKSESVKKPGNMKKTIEDTLLLIEKEMMRHSIEVKTEIVEVPEISYDAGQISQVLMNLMNNARDALKDRQGKQITIGLKPKGEGVLLDIGDNGSGIPPQVLKRLFEPFVTSKPAGQGTGLGLSVCHGIIRNHGGEISVTTAPEKGTTWHIFFPKT